MGMWKRSLLLLTLGLGFGAVAHGQRLPTATKLLDIQAGGEFVYGNSDYGRKLKGYGGYATVDFKPHFGLVLDFHQANGTDLVYERTYEVGGRYVRHYGKWNPYAKLMYGRGVFNFPPLDPLHRSSGNIAYNLGAIGGGADYKLRRSINLRGDFEYQEWKGAKPFLPNGLTPYLASVGVAYHFH
jgi:hypothetical protein